MRAQATYRNSRAWHRGFTYGVWSGVLWATMAFIAVMTIASFYTPQGFC